MCSIKSSWQQYAYSILLLISIFVSYSSQQQPINQPRPFQRSFKTVGEDVNGFKPIGAPLQHIQTAPVEVKHQNVQFSQTKSTPEPIPTTTAISQIDKTIDKNAASEKRSIRISFEDLEDLAWAFVGDAFRSGNGAIQKRSIDQRALLTDLFFNQDIIGRVKKFTEKYIFQAASASSFKDLLPTSGRLFLFKGMSL